MDYEIHRGFLKSISYDYGDKKSVIPNTVKYIGAAVFQSCQVIREVIISEGVEIIGDNAFKNCSKLKIVSLPSSLKTIGDSAFAGCTSLESLVIPDGITVINDKAFQGCSSLRRVILPKTLVSINKEVFSRCISLFFISLPDSLECLGDKSFSDCSYLKVVKYNGRLSFYGSNVFKGCDNLKLGYIDKEGFHIIFSNILLRYHGREPTVRVPDGVSIICEEAFGDDWDILQSVSIPPSVREIQAHAFSGCMDLMTVNLRNGLITIGEGAFMYCRKLKSVVIPDTVINIGKSAFEETGCENVKLSRGLSVISERMFACCSIRRIEIPYNVKKIKREAFNNCEKLKSVLLPDSVESIEYGAFSRCISMSEINFPQSLSSVWCYSFGKCARIDFTRIFCDYTVLDNLRVFIAFEGNISYQYHVNEHSICAFRILFFKAKSAGWRKFKPSVLFADMLKILNSETYIPANIWENASQYFIEFNAEIEPEQENYFFSLLANAKRKDLIDTITNEICK